MAGPMPAGGAAQGGLLRPGTAARGGEPPMPGAGAEGEPTPREQELYEHVVANAMTAIYGGETAEMLVGLLEPGEGGYPVEALANVVAPMMIGIEASAAANGAPVSREMTVQAALEIIEDIGTELLPASGRAPLPQEHIEGAFLRTCQLIGADEQAVRERMPGGAADAPPGGGPMRRRMAGGA